MPKEQQPTSKDVQNFLKDIEKSHSEEMPTGARTLLRSLIDCDEEAIESNVNTIIFGKDAIKAGNPGVADDALRKRVQFFNSYNEQADTSLVLKSRKHHFELSFDSEKINTATSHKVVELSKDIAETHNEKPPVQPELRLEPTVFISHKWHKDQDLRNIFHSVVEKLDDYLSKPPKDKPTVKLFYSTSPKNGFKPDSDRQTQQDSWCQEAQIGLILWSQQYDHSEHCKRELSFFINSEGKNKPGKKAIVILDHGRHQDMPEYLAARNTYFYPPDNEVSMVDFWEQSRISEKHSYIATLADRIFEAFTNPTPTVKTEPLDQKLLRAGHNQSFETLKSNATQEPEAFGDHDEKDQRLELIPVLKNWANDFSAKSTRVSVLLGDFGFGKTVSCRLLNKVLSDEYQDHPHTAMLPLYLDLKALQADIANHKSKPVEHLLESMLEKTEEKHTISGEEVIRHIRNNSCLVIVDGFDEIGHHLTEAEQQAVYDSLLSIIPNDIYRRDGERLLKKEGCVSDARYFPSKLLISCRTHFFNRFSKEESFISGSNRHALGANGTDMKNIRRFYMAPFSASTVEIYLCSVLGDDEGLRAKNMLGDIHDLSELSSHPIMLDLITKQLPRLQDQQQAGKTINSAVLYLNLFEKIGQRDIGKHKIRLSDKQELLAALAIHLWRKKQTSISFHHLDKWFADYAATHRTIKHQITASTHAMQELMQDLCNASLLVRDKDRYRFAHTSYLEFFRAIGLYEAIRQYDDLNCFDGLTSGAEVEIDHETLQFLLNWHAAVETEDREEFSEKFVHLLESDSNLNIRKLGFDIWQFGHLNISDDAPEFPHSPGANWSGMHFENELVPDQLRALDYSQVNLSQSTFHRVHFNTLRLSRANFKDSYHSQGYFHDCKLESSTWKGADISADCFWPHSLDYLKTANNTKAHKLLNHLGHFDQVNCAVFNPDDNYIISASDDMTLKMWDIHSGICVRTFKGHTGAVNCIAFREDSNYIISGSDDYSLRLWDTSSGNCIRVYKGHKSTVSGIAFSHDGKQIVSASSDKTLILWDVDSRKHIRIFEGHTKPVKSVAFNHDSSLIVSGSSNKTLKVWDVDSGKCTTNIKHEYSATSVAFSKDSNYVLSPDASTIKLWDRYSGELIKDFKGHNNLVNSATFSNDGKHIVSAAGYIDLFNFTGGGNIIKLWDIETGECNATFKGHDKRVNSAEFSSDDNYIISTSEDGTLKLWDRRTGHCIKTFEARRGSINSVMLDADNEHFVTASDDKTIRTWGYPFGESTKIFNELNSIINCAIFSHNGNYIAAASKKLSFLGNADNNEITLWGTQSNKQIRAFKEYKSEINSIAFNHDSTQIISASGGNTLYWESDNNTLRLWDTNSGDFIRSFEGHTGTINSAKFSLNSAYIVSASGESFQRSSTDNTLKIWKTSSGECVRTIKGHTAPVTSAMFNCDDSKIVSASCDNTLKLWNTSSGKCIKTFKGHTGAVLNVDFNQDSSHIVSASEDCTIKLWNTYSGTCIRSFKGHTLAVKSATFSHDSKHIISASNDNTVRLWDVETGECLFVILQTPKGESRYTENTEEILPQSIRGDAWRYCYAKDDDGNIVHPCQYEGWGKIYKP